MNEIDGLREEADKNREALVSWEAVSLLKWLRESQEFSQRKLDHL